MPHDPPHDHPPGHRPRVTGEDWDELYGEENGNRWSGAPNGSLMVEVEGLDPGRVVDLGCGEGGDAIWLATQGWDVTGIDISVVALERARIAADNAGVDVAWVCRDFIAHPPPRAGFDLVTTHYPALPRSRAEAAIASLLCGVAPGGTLLFVAHHLVDREFALSHGFDPDDYLGPEDVLQRLDENWSVLVNDVRDRAEPVSERSPHAADHVLKAVRLM